MSNTPTPWHAEGPDMFGDWNILHSGDALAIGAVVTNMRPAEEVAANAALIVTAVNAMEPMKTALEEAREMIKDDRRAAALECIERALRLAEGETK